MKDHLVNLALAATVLLMALVYYYSHDALSRLMVNAPASLIRLVAR